MTDQAKCDSEQAKRELIKEVQQLGKLWDGVAVKEAVLFARKPDDAERKAAAQTAIARSDLANNIAEQVIELIHKYWPR